jgi:hypothetical protein
MLKASEFLDRYKLAAAALLASAALHAAVFVGMPPRIDALEEGTQAVYSASLDPAALVAEAPSAAPAPTPRRVAKPRPRSRIAPPPAVAEPLAPEVVAVGLPLGEALPKPARIEEPGPPDVVALAAPATPAAAPLPPKFPMEGLPARLSVTYSLTSALADGRAVYEWSRDGERYEITSEAEAVGFFTLFLEGRIRQESRGTVTDEGLRPERFVEHRPNADDEGVEFDWAGKQVTFQRGSSKRTEAITGNSIDWLSMIFQLAHVPPAGETFELHVFTQRRFYEFQLKILGVEEIEIPIGKVRALHLRHENPEDQEVVDVWLGVDQHNLPVKLRFPVARNRIMVEQVATDISER